MRFNLIAKTQQGKIALQKLSKEFTFGLASKKTVCEDPFTLQIGLKGMGRLQTLVQANKKNLLAMIRGTWTDILKDYGATENDYEAEVL